MRAVTVRAELAPHVTAVVGKLRMGVFIMGNLDSLPAIDSTAALTVHSRWRKKPKLESLIESLLTVMITINVMIEQILFVFPSLFVCLD